MTLQQGSCICVLALQFAESWKHIRKQVLCALMVSGATHVCIVLLAMAIACCLTLQVPE